MEYTYFNKDSKVATLEKLTDEDVNMIKRIAPMVGGGELSLQEAFKDNLLRGFYVEFFRLQKGMDIFHINYLRNNIVVVSGEFVHNKGQKTDEREMFNGMDIGLSYPYLAETRPDEAKLQERFGYPIHDKITKIVRIIGFLLLERATYSPDDLDFYKQMERDTEF